MKKLFFFFSFLVVTVAGFSQATGPFPNYQQQGSPTTRWTQQGAVQGMKGIINGIYPDTLTANNLSYIDFYPGAQIFTTLDSTLWLRNSNATRWMRNSSGTGSITSFTFITDSSIVICFADGSCDTIPINNLTNIVNNIVQNFNDSTVFNINDSTILICVGIGSERVCDTIHLGNTNNFFFLNDSTLVTCDTLETVCIGDSCYQQQICDTIPIPKITITVYQNWLQKLPGSHIVEVGAPGFGGFGGAGDLVHETFLNSRYPVTLNSGAIGPAPLTLKQFQWVQENSSIMAFNSYGKYPPTDLLDGNNPVYLRINYTDPFVGDTSGFMGDRYGYLLMTNSRGARFSYGIDDMSAKQVGIFFDTYSPNTEAVTVFGNKVPSIYNFTGPFDSTLLDSRIAVFKTNGQVQFPQYTPNAFPISSATHVLVTDADGNIFQFPPSGTVGGLLLSANNGLSVLNDTAVQLGQAIGASGNPAILLNHREIPLANFTINFNADAAQSNNMTVWKNSSAAIRARVTSAASFSNTGGQANSEIFGDLASVSGTGSVVIGNSAVSATNSVSIGVNANSGAGANVVIGANAASGNFTGITVIGTSATNSGSNNSTIIGSSATATSRGTGLGNSVVVGGANVTALGEQANASHTYSIALGFAATTTAANQFVLGGNVNSGTEGGVDNIHFGEGVFSETPNNVSITPNGGLGINIAGGSFTLNGSPATGNAAGGSILLSTSNAGGSGTTLQALTEKARMDVSGVFAIGITSAFTATRLNAVDNGLAGNALASLTTTSTAATGDNLQRVLSVVKSGTQVSAVNSSAIYVSNTTVPGFGAYSFGVYSDASFPSGSGTGVSIRAVATNHLGVWATATTGTAILGQSATLNAQDYTIGGFNTGTGAAVQGQATGGHGVRGISLGSGYGGAFVGTLGGVFGQGNDNHGGYFLDVFSGNPDASVQQVVRIEKQNGGTVNDGSGLSVDMYLSSTTAVQLANQIISKWTTAANATRTSQLLFTGVNSATTGDIISFEGNKRTMLYGRLEMQQGADVASVAGAIAVGLDGNVFELTGTNAVTLISNLNFVNGSVIYILFTSTATLTDGTANSGTDIGMELLGNANFVGSAEDVVCLVLSEIGGTQRWRMVSSSVN